VQAADKAANPTQMFDLAPRLWYLLPSAEISARVVKP
jgi:hypothetical protein